MRRLALACALPLALACGASAVVEVDKADLEGYQAWASVEATGAIPAHGDTIRVIYANEAATRRVTEGAGRYPAGSVIVKEIYQRDGEGAGALDYIAVMRMLTQAPEGGALHSLSFDDQGWLFTDLRDGIDGDEAYSASCWDSCHVASPFDGAFLDYATD